MTSAMDENRRLLLLAVFCMPSVQGMKQRKSSITNAFVNAIIPVVQPSPEEILEALTILEMEPEHVRCAYCGDPTTEWDHLRPLVISRRPTGFISEIANLVPACGKCNQSKGNKNWRTWMLGAAKRSPTGRKIADINERIARIDNYEAWRQPTKVDFESLLGADAWQHYWSLWDKMNIALNEAQVVADEMRTTIKRRIAGD